MAIGCMFDGREFSPGSFLPSEVSRVQLSIVRFTDIYGPHLSSSRLGDGLELETTTVYLI